MTDTGNASPAKSPIVPATAAVCPYLMAPDGRWRASTPAREHRCTVVTPPAILAAEKQRRLCLVAEHVGCSTYLAALAPTERPLDETVSTPVLGDRRPGRPVARTAPLVLDHGRRAIAIPALHIERVAGQHGLVALMALAFAAIVVARLSAGGPDLTPTQVAGGAAASPSVATSPAPTLPDASGAPSRTLVPTEAEPTPAAASPTGSGSVGPRTYEVRSGDTLNRIAAEFGTTPKVLIELNGIDDPRRLRIGQVLKLP